MKTPPTFWAKLLDHLIVYAVKRGVDKSKLIAELDVSTEVAADPWVRLPLPIFYEAVERCVVTLDDPCFGLHYVSDSGPVSADALGFLTRFSPSLGDAVDAFMNQLSFLLDPPPLTRRTRDDTVVFQLDLWGPPSVGKAQTVDMFAAGFLNLPARLLGRSLGVRGVKFEHAAPGAQHLGEYAAALGYVPEFSASENSWSYETQSLTFAFPRANAELTDFFHRYIDERAPALVESVASSVEKAVLAALRSNQPILPSVAKQLHMSMRTAQRRLREASLSLRSIVADVRYREAQKYLKADVPHSEIVRLLGFASAAAFQRAFKSWAGMTPASWRERVRGGAFTLPARS